MARLHESSSTLSVRVAPELMQQLDQLALAEGRTRSFIAEEALKRYVKEESWQVQAIHHALETADAGEAKFADHGEVKTWLKSWGSSATSTSPKCK
ncbi:MAG: ribbon-helix-helix protein, CopG family [Proteobacteria bacterium]|nr:ribbon-helix-helix protein, CopG family [Pseudomonadota bacterium]